MAQPNERAREIFQRFASPVSILFGVVFGAVYTVGILSGHLYASRIGLSAVFFTGGLMGTIYFEVSAVRTRLISYIAEQNRVFYFVLFLFGVTFLIAAIGTAPVMSNESLLALQSFLVGMIAGTIWMMALILLIGLRYNVGEWPVIRFPVWIGVSLIYVYRSIKRMLSWSK